MSTPPTTTNEDTMRITKIQWGAILEAAKYTLPHLDLLHEVNEFLAASPAQPAGPTIFTKEMADAWGWVPQEGDEWLSAIHGHMTDWKPIGSTTKGAEFMKGGIFRRPCPTPQPAGIVTDREVYSACCATNVLTTYPNLEKAGPTFQKICKDMAEILNRCLASRSTVAQQEEVKGEWEEFDGKEAKERGWKRSAGLQLQEHDGTWGSTDCAPHIPFLPGIRYRRRKHPEQISQPEGERANLPAEGTSITPSSPSSGTPPKEAGSLEGQAPDLQRLLKECERARERVSTYSAKERAQLKSEARSLLSSALQQEEAPRAFVDFRICDNCIGSQACMLEGHCLKRPVKCPRCDGSGKYKRFIEPEKECFLCNGSGWVNPTESPSEFPVPSQGEGETPETIAKYNSLEHRPYTVLWKHTFDFCRQMERSRNEARAKCAELEKSIEALDAEITSDLKAQLEEARKEQKNWEQLHATNELCIQNQHKEIKRLQEQRPRLTVEQVCACLLAADGNRRILTDRLNALLFPEPPKEDEFEKWWNNSELFKNLWPSGVPFDGSGLAQIQLKTKQTCKAAWLAAREVKS